MVRLFHWTSIGSLLALIFLCVAWELWLAPLRPGGSWIALKALPLLIPLFGILHGRIYTHQWAPAFALLYAAEGLVRGWSETGVSSALGVTEFLLATSFTVSAALYVREKRKIYENAQ